MYYCVEPKRKINGGKGKKNGGTGKGHGMEQGRRRREEEDWRKGRGE